MHDKPIAWFRHWTSLVLATKRIEENANAEFNGKLEISRANDLPMAKLMFHWNQGWLLKTSVSSSRFEHLLMHVSREVNVPSSSKHVEHK